MAIRYIILVILVLFVGACADRGRFVLDPEAAKVGALETIFIATNRGKDKEGDFDGSRAERLSFERVQISVPPDRRPGEVKWPSLAREVEPTKQFLLVSRKDYPDAAQYREDLSKALVEHDNRVFIFVHGYNTNLAEGTFRLAQIGFDLKLPGVLSLYSWPSAAEVLGYVYDRDSALLSRDYLQKAMQELADAGAKKIVLLAHSIGSEVAMETLRQMSIGNDQDLLKRIEAVVLISADIDIDVFRNQAKDIKKLPQPFILITSARDRALRISSGLTGLDNRLGSLTDISRVSDFPITVLDTAAFSESIGHFNLSNPALLDIINRYALVSRALDETTGKVGLLPGVVLSVRNVTEVILEQPAAAVEAMAGGVMKAITHGAEP